MLVTSMPLHRVVDDSGEEVEVNMLVEMISAPIEQREELDWQDWVIVTPSL